jgi:hypothetical protein
LGRRRRQERRFDREATRYQMRQRMLILATTAVIDTMVHPDR